MCPVQSNDYTGIVNKLHKPKGWGERTIGERKCCMDGGRKESRKEGGKDERKKKEIKFCTG